jgi:hypothetical protein
MTYRQFFADLPTAQAFADSVHSQMIATDVSYAASVAIGQTKRWDIPRVEIDGGGTPTGQFSVVIKTRALPVLTAPQTATLVPDLPTAPAVSNLGVQSQGVTP